MKFLTNYFQFYNKVLPKFETSNTSITIQIGYTKTMLLYFLHSQISITIRNKKPNSVTIQKPKSVTYQKTQKYYYPKKFRSKIPPPHTL